MKSENFSYFVIWYCKNYFIISIVIKYEAQTGDYYSHGRKVVESKRTDLILGLN